MSRPPSRCPRRPAHRRPGSARRSAGTSTCVVGRAGRHRPDRRLLPGVPARRRHATRRSLAKLPPPIPATREMLAGAYRGEVTFYADLRRPSPSVVPRCRLRRDPADSGESATSCCSQDLAPAVQGDQVAGCTVAQARTAVGQPRRPARPALVRPRADRRRRAQPQRSRGRRDPGRALRPGDRDRSSSAPGWPVPDRGRRDPAARASGVIEGRGCWRASERFGLVHGDYRLDNLMFGPRTAATGLGGGLADAVASPCRPATSPTSSAPASTVDDRRRAERDLVAAYHRGAGRARRSTDGTTLDACWDDYAFAMLQGPLVACSATPTAPAPSAVTGCSPRWSQRACAAIRDHDTLARAARG